jgi:uncharacterized membrane protein (Fun14 family)
MHKKLYLPVAVLLLLTIGLELLSIHLSQKLASDSVMVKKIQSNIAKLDEENHILNSKVLAQTSFEVISGKAAVLGFVEGPAYISLRKSFLSYNQ